MLQLVLVTLFLMTCSEVVLDTYEVFDLSEKSWSLPQHLGAERAGLGSNGLVVIELSNALSPHCP